MERAITAYHQDAVPEWVAELECGHDQHVRHRPPFQLRAWVTEETGRTAKLGMPLNCPLCDRAEMPEGLMFVRSGLEFTEQTVPRRLLQAHRLGRGTWGRIAVHTGTLRFIMAVEPPIDVVLGPGSSHAVPPQVDHELRPLGSVAFTIDLFTVDGRRTIALNRDLERGASRQEERDEGGDPACWVGLVCPDCGAVLNGGAHRKDCHTVRSADSTD